MPYDMDPSSWRVEMLGYGVGVPALTSGAVLLVSWPWRRRAMADWPVALALGLGYAAGHVGIEGWRPFPPREAADRLEYLALAAVVPCFLDRWRLCWLSGWVPRAGLWFAVVWLLLPPSLRTQASGAEATAWFAGLGLAGWLFGAMLTLTARRLPGALLPCILLLVSLGTAGVLLAGHSLKLTQLAGIFAATLLPLVIRSLCHPSAVLATTPVVVILPGLWLTSYFYSYEPPPLASLLLLAAAALSGSLVLLPGLRGLAGWQRFLICVAAASLLVGWAVIVAQGMRKADEELLRSQPGMGVVTINTIK